jgi:RhtB (resistance to homoserine/threonine) family protein
VPEGQLVAFLGVALLLTVTPGADMALVTRQALSSGHRAAVQTTFGIITGLVVWATLSAAGLAALLTTSATAFAVLKLLGAAYLVYLGLQTLWQTRQGNAPAAPGQRVPGTDRVTGPQAYRQGLLSNLLNPKVGVFYTTFLPQFVAADAPALPQLLTLALLHIVMGLVWLLAYTQLVVTAGDWLRRPPIRRWLDRLTGAVLVALGLRLAVERR